jgi:4-carboxymuconolactone decarboxylase
LTLCVAAQFKSHLGLAVKNDITKAELIETITRLAFYAGWPNSVTAVMTAKEVFDNSAP